MTTSISSEARRNQILISGRENHFSPKPDGQTDRQTDLRTGKRTDISSYRVASTLKIMAKQNAIYSMYARNLNELRRVKFNTNRRQEDTLST